MFDERNVRRPFREQHPVLGDREIRIGRLVVKPHAVASNGEFLAGEATGVHAELTTHQYTVSNKEQIAGRVLHARWHIAQQQLRALVSERIQVEIAQWPSTGVQSLHDEEHSLAV